MRSLLFYACAALLGLSLDVPAAAQEAPPPPIAIVHAKVYVPGGKDPLPNGTVVIDKGKIVVVGDDLAPPAGARVIDARGKVVTPGFIDAESQVGVVDVEEEEQTDDTDARGDMNPALRMVDGYNPRSAVVPITRAEGVTSVIVAPRAGVLGGQSAFADLAGDAVNDAIVRPVLAQYASVAEGIAQHAAGTRGGLWNMLREALEDARFYATHRGAYDANQVRQLSLRRAGLEALVPVVQGNLPLVVHAHRASDIEAALRLADDLKLKLVLSGASEAWMIADDLARRKVPVIVDPLEDLPQRFDRLHSRSDNAAMLQRAGVRVIIATYASHQSRLLWQHAGNAVRTGMDHDAAIRAITETPADAFGLKGYGRLEKGAVANVVVWSGDPLQLSTRVEHVFVRGREQSLETRQTLLRDRYRTLPVPRDGSR
ncbi:MAG TPA: amidohydrolase family protein [Polyangiaceae bacterium]